MGRYLLRRILISIPVLLGITIAMYIIANMAPGDPITALMNPEQAANMGPEWVEQQKERLGLNDPMPIRYLKWLGQTVQGNLGYSFADRLPVSEKIAERFRGMRRGLRAGAIAPSCILRDDKGGERCSAC